MFFLVWYWYYEVQYPKGGFFNEHCQKKLNVLLQKFEMIKALVESGLSDFEAPKL